jgi:hypothetical protein
MTTDPAKREASFARVMVSNGRAAPRSRSNSQDAWLRLACPDGLKSSGYEWHESGCGEAPSSSPRRSLLSHAARAYRTNRGRRSPLAWE